MNLPGDRPAMLSALQVLFWRLAAAAAEAIARRRRLIQRFAPHAPLLLAGLAALAAGRLVGGLFN